MLSFKKICYDLTNNNFSQEYYNLMFNNNNWKSYIGKEKMRILILECKKKNYFPNFNQCLYLAKYGYDMVKIITDCYTENDIINYLNYCLTNNIINYRPNLSFLFINKKFNTDIIDLLIELANRNLLKNTFNLILENITFTQTLTNQQITILLPHIITNYFFSNNMTKSIFIPDLDYDIILKILPSIIKSWDRMKILKRLFKKYNFTNEQLIEITKIIAPYHSSLIIFFNKYGISYFTDELLLEILPVITQDELVHLAEKYQYVDKKLFFQQIFNFSRKNKIFNDFKIFYNDPHTTYKIKDEIFTSFFKDPDFALVSINIKIYMKKYIVKSCIKMIYIVAY
jgi:hypothetical protein